MMTDPIADMLTRIRNANAIKNKRLTMPASRIKVGIAQILADEGFIDSYEVEEGVPSSKLHVRLRYGPEGQYVLRSIQRVSRPGRRVYTKANEIPTVLSGLGAFVLSTPKGILSDRRARQENVGGEILCKVY